MPLVFILLVGVAEKLSHRDLIRESGCFRSRPVGVVDKQGNILHFGTLPDYVPGLVAELLEWVKTSDYHLLIKSCVFHYELELIHPFSDGNGRIGRLWHTLLLSRWKPVFAWLPVESIIHDRQQEYYEAINLSNSMGESTPFIGFMLSAIQEALTDAAQSSTSPLSTDQLRRQKIGQFLQVNPFITNADVRQLLGVSAATVNRILAKLTEEAFLQKIRVGKTWGYKR